MLDLIANRIPKELRAAVVDRIGKLIVLYEVDHPDGYVRGWSGTGNLSFQGQVWRGLGDLVAVDGIGGSRKTEVRVISATLAGLTARQLQFVTRKLRGRIARLSLAALRSDQRAVAGKAYPVCVGRCDSQDHKIEQGKASIVLSINKALYIADRHPNLAWTPDWLKATYGDVDGLDDIPGVAARTVSWTPS